jgi:hypothetical protein
MAPCLPRISHGIFLFAEITFHLVDVAKFVDVTTKALANTVFRTCVPMAFFQSIVRLRIDILALLGYYVSAAKYPSFAL